jgi:alkyl hydroperoxide reductase subunit F
MYDVIIVGGGPAGTAAAIYSARKRIKTLLVTDSFGGQSIVSDDIENWIGETHISGVELTEKFENHIRAYENEIDIKEGERVKKVRKIESEEDGPCNFEIETEKGEVYKGKAVIFTTGGRRRKLGIPGEREFERKGVVYCSTCDAPVFENKKTAVVGGGNAGAEAVIDLLPYAEKIYLLEAEDKLSADKLTQEKISKEDKVEIILNAFVKEIKGDDFVNALVYKNKEGAEEILEVDGVFVEIGSFPNSEPLKDLVDLDKFGQIIIDSKYASTSQKGVFSAGDVTDDPYKQNNISAGDGVKAALSAYNYIQKTKEERLEK